MIIADFFFVSLACAAISTTIARSKLTGPVRDWVRSKSPYLGSTLSCPYCMAHWIAFGLVLITGIKFSESFSFLINFFVVSFSVIGMAVIFNGIIMRLNFLHEHEIERLEDTLTETQATLKNLLDTIGILENGE